MKVSKKISLILTLTLILTLKCVFLFFKLVIFWMRFHQISSVAVCIELIDFLDNIFRMPIFKPQFDFFEILKANMIRHHERVMTIWFFPVVLIIRGQNHENITCEKIVCRRISIWGTIWWRANISHVIIHIRIVWNNAKYLITWSDFVRFANSRYQHNLEIISYAFGHFLCRWQSTLSTIHLFTFPPPMLHLTCRALVLILQYTV